jgi:nucleoside-diphosphate-sugar epimerase
VDGLHRLMRSDWRDPINLGSDRMISINELIAMIARISGKRITTKHVLDRPQGPRGRNSDNTRVREVLGWSERVPLEDGMARTYRWIEAELRASERRYAAAAH